MLGYGIESGSQRILDILRKGVKVDQAKKAIQMTREAKMIVGYTFMLGSPRETEETIEDSVKFCKQLHLSPKFFITTPYPGTQLYQMAMERNLIANEEEYIKTLGDATELRVNLTEWPDEELLALIQNAEKRTKVNLLKTAYFFYKDYGIKMFLKMLKYFGLHGLFDLLRNSFGKVRRE